MRPRSLHSVIGAMVLLGILGSAPALADSIKCQREILKRSERFARAKMKALQKCGDKIVKGQLSDPGQGWRLAFCLADSKTAAKIQKADSKLRVSLDKKCGGADKKCSTLGDNDTLPSIGWPSTCPDFENAGCNSAIDHCDDIGDCLICVYEAAVDQAISLYYEDLDVAGSVGNKELINCQRTIGKATAKFFDKKIKLLRKCEDKVLQGKIAGLCPDLVTQVKIARAEAKKFRDICKKCGGVNRLCGGVDDLSVSEIGFRDPCPAVIIPAPNPSGTPRPCGGPVGDLQDLVDCVDCVTEFKVDCLDPFTVPSLKPYPSECVGSTPTLTPTPTPTETPTATPTPFLPNGQPCPGGANECQSGNCVDGVCCDSPCTGECQACNVPGSEGTCSCIPRDDTPPGECPGSSCMGPFPCACSTPSCGSSIFPRCNGPCPVAGEVCISEDPGQNCVCIPNPSPSASPCNLDAAPACGGVCSVQAPNCIATSGSCVCFPDPTPTPPTPTATPSPCSNTASVNLERGKGHYLNAPDSASLSVTGDLTIELWVKLTTVPAGRIFHFVAKAYDPVLPDQRSYLFKYGDSNNSISFLASADGINFSSWDLQLFDPLLAGSWVHVAAVYTAGAAKVEFFKNGTSLGTPNPTFPTTSVYDSSADLEVGVYDPNGTGYIDGMVDEVRIWAEARTEEEIADNMALCLAPQAPLRGYYRLENSYDDASGNNNTLTPHSETGQPLPAFSASVPW